MADRWSINGFDLDTLGDDPFGVQNSRLLVETSWRPNVSARRAPLTLPGQHGSVDTGLPIYDEPTLTLKVGALANRDEVRLEQVVQALLTVLTQPTLAVTRLSGGVSMSATARLVTVDVGDHSVGEFAALTAVLAIPGVFFSETATVSPVTSLAASVANVPIAHLAGSTAPVRAMVARVRGPLTGITISNPVSGTSITWSGTVSSSQYLFIEPFRLLARLSTDPNSWWSGTSATPGLSYDPGAILALWPKVGTNLFERSVEFSAAVAGNGATTAIAWLAGRSWL